MQCHLLLDKNYVSTLRMKGEPEMCEHVFVPFMDFIKRSGLTYEKVVPPDVYVSLVLMFVVVKDGKFNKDSVRKLN